MKTILGTTDEVTTCECCGRTDLKKTVVIRVANGEVQYFGTTCAEKNLNIIGKEITARAASADKANMEAATLSFQAWRDDVENLPAVKQANRDISALNMAKMPFADRKARRAEINARIQDATATAQRPEDSFISFYQK